MHSTLPGIAQLDLVPFLLPERKLNLPIDVILRQYHDKSDGKQTDYNRYTQKWEDKRSEAFKIADDSTKVRNADKRHKDQKRTFKPLEVARKFCLEFERERGEQGKLRSFFGKTRYAE